VQYNFSTLELQTWEDVCAFCQRKLCLFISLLYDVVYPTEKDCVTLYFREKSFLHEDLDQSKGGTFRNALVLPTDLANKFGGIFLFCFILVLLETGANFVRKPTLLVVPVITYTYFGLFFS